MNDRQFDSWLATVKPIGCLHHKHPVYRFGAVYEENGKFVLGPGVDVPHGFEVRKWSGGTFVVE